MYFHFTLKNHAQHLSYDSLKSSAFTLDSAVTWNSLISEMCSDVFPTDFYCLYPLITDLFSDLSWTFSVLTPPHLPMYYLLPS